MTKILDVPFSTGSDFSNVKSIYSNGLYYTGLQAPNGIPNRIWIEDDACHIYLNTADAPTYNWKRSECEFGNLPTTFGQFWTSFDFMYTWEFNYFVVIGGIPNILNGQFGVAYVNIGYRIEDHHLLVQAPRDFSTANFYNRVVCKVPIVPNKWYSLLTHINLQSDTTGFIELFLDGVTIAKEWNLQTAHSTATGHYFKTGVYDGEHLEKFSEAKILMRNISVWEGNDGYQTIMGGVPLCPTRLIQP